MADKSTEAILEGLRRAMANPDLILLHGTKVSAGLFASNTAGKAAAQRCKDEGYLQVVQTEQKGRSVLEHCTLTERGIAFLLAEGDPRQLLEDFVRAMEAREAQLTELLTLTQNAQQSLEETRRRVQQLLPRLQQPLAGTGADSVPPSLDQMVLTALENWRTMGSSQDCPLPHVYQQVKQRMPDLSIGTFHDELRHLQERGEIYLHPWTAPLYQIPEPALALLVGHEIAYYASQRNSKV